MNNFQFTFYDREKRYRPITVTIVPRNENEKIASLKQRAIKKAMAERGWSIHDMMYKYGYTSYRFKQVDKKGKPIIKVTREG